MNNHNQASVHEKEIDDLAEYIGQIGETENVADKNTFRALAKKGASLKKIKSITKNWIKTDVRKVMDDASFLYAYRGSIRFKNKKFIYFKDGNKNSIPFSNLERASEFFCESIFLSDKAKKEIKKLMAILSKFLELDPQGSAITKRFKKYQKREEKIRKKYSTIRKLKISKTFSQERMHFAAELALTPLINKLFYYLNPYFLTKFDKLNRPMDFPKKKITAKYVSEIIEELFPIKISPKNILNRIVNQHN